MGEASEPDCVSIEFPGATPAEAAIIARECARALQAAGLNVESIKIARSERDAMDLGGALVLLGWAFIEGLAKGAGESVGKAAWRTAVKGLEKLPEAIQRVLESISQRHRTPVQIQGAAGRTWTIGDGFRREPLATDANGAAGFGTLGIVILGASEFPHMNDSTLNNPAFARSAALAKSLFSPPNTAFAGTAVLDLFDTDLQPLNVLDAVERHIDAHPGMRDLLIYYCGHGSFHQDSTYFLLLRTTRAGREMLTGFAPRALRHDLGTRLLDRRVYFVVDACFSGSFVDGLQGDAALDRVVGSQLTLDMPHRGWSVLTASAKDKWAMSPRGEEYTMFTGALAHVITNGTNAAGVRFNLYDLAEEARSYLTRRWKRGAVLPQCISPMQDAGDVGRLPIFLNRLAQAESAPDGATEDVDRYRPDRSHPGQHDGIGARGADTRRDPPRILRDSTALPRPPLAPAPAPTDSKTFAHAAPLRSALGLPLLALVAYLAVYASGLYGLGQGQFYAPVPPLTLAASLGLGLYWYAGERHSEHCSAQPSCSL